MDERAAAVPNMMRLALLLIVCAAAAHAFPSMVGGCKEVTTQPNFNLTKFTSHKWFIHKQMTIKYLPANERYCVVATYTQKDATHIKVHNYANINHTNGPVDDSDVHVKALGGICGKATGDVASKLEVGPCYLGVISRFTYGPYWVVAAGDSSCVGATCPQPEQYEWALISGGQPKHQTAGGCTTGTGVNDSGMWIFQAASQRNETLLAGVEAIAKAKGFDISVLHDVEQAGCKYLPPSA